MGLVEARGVFVQILGLDGGIDGQLGLCGGYRRHQGARGASQ
jgi:hypothetical protein